MKKSKGTIKETVTIAFDVEVEVPCEYIQDTELYDGHREKVAIPNFEDADVLTAAQDYIDTIKRQEWKNIEIGY